MPDFVRDFWVKSGFLGVFGSVLVRSEKMGGSVVRPNLTEPSSSAEPEPEPERFGLPLIETNIQEELPDFGNFALDNSINTYNTEYQGFVNFPVHIAF